MQELFDAVRGGERTVRHPFGGLPESAYQTRAADHREHACQRDMVLYRPPLRRRPAHPGVGQHGVAGEGGERLIASLLLDLVKFGVGVARGDALGSGWGGGHKGNPKEKKTADAAARAARVDGLEGCSE